MTNATATVVEDSDYYPFGGERVFTDTLDNQYKFTGHERDTESGLDYYQYRMLATNLGRWTTTDPLMASAYEPQSLNRYGYVVNNSTNFTDPDGRFHQVGCWDVMFDPWAPPELVMYCLHLYNPTPAPFLLDVIGQFVQCGDCFGRCVGRALDDFKFVWKTCRGLPSRIDRILCRHLALDQLQRSLILCAEKFLGCAFLDSPSWFPDCQPWQ